MANVYLALKRSVVFVLLLLCQAAFAQPVINGFSPTSAWPGLPVTISGSGFSPVAGNNIVYFGPVRAAVQSASTNTLNVTVPVGATYAPITVTVNGLTAYSRLPFNVTFQSLNTTLDTNDFGSRRDVLGIFTPRSITMADFDSDGRTDLFVTNQFNNNVVVLRNTGAPQTVSFAVKSFPSAANPFGSAAGDLDGDGKVDIAVANAYSPSAGSVTVFRNSSISDTIIFDTASYATASLSQRVAINDIDGDGKPDLLVTSNNSNIISVFRNTTTTPGSITFAPKIDLMTGPGPRDLAVADLDGDGKPELVSLAAGVTTTDGYGVSLWRNLSTPGAISFASRVHISTVVGPTALKVGDLNNDGKLDIAVASFFGGNISFFRNTSTVGSFSFGGRQDIATGGRPQRLSIGDVNGDSRPDVAVCFDTARAIYIFPGIAGDSIKFGNRVAFKAGVLAGDIAIGDVDGDGEADLTFCHSEGVFGNPVTVLRNKLSNETPVINSFTPTSAAKGAFVNIFGKNLSNVSAVRFGSYFSDSVRVVNDSVVQARVKNGATGDVTVYTQYGVASKAGFTYLGDTTNVPDSTCPVITSFNPTSGKKGAAVFILGSNFTGSTAVRFGGVLADSIVIINDTLIKAIVDTGATGSVQVISPYCSASKPGFTYIRDTTQTPDTTVFAIYNFTPKSGTRGTVVTIFGSGFNKTWDVRFGGVSADSIKVLSDTTIRAVVGDGASGAVSVVATNGSRSLPGFTYIPDTTSPIIGDFWPRSGQRGTIVQILGNRLGSTTAVSFGGVPADSIWVTSDTSVKAIVGNGATGKVSVTTPYGTASVSGFTYIADTTNIPDTTCPVITSFWPTSGQQGTAVYILGSNFTGSSAVRFGGVLADSIVIMSDTMIKAIVDTGATGSVQVLSSTCLATMEGFTYIRDTTHVPDTTLPVIINFWPTSGTKGTEVYILGTHITNATHVYFGGVAADSIIIVSDTMIKAIVDTGATGSVSLFTPYGYASKPGFTYISDTTINDTLFVNARTAIANGVIQKSFKLYPNPASKYVTWQQPVTNHKTRLQLVDMFGRIVRQMEVGSNTPQTTMQLNGLTTGIYKLVYIDGKNKITSTLLIK